MKTKDPNRKPGKKARNSRRGNHEGTIRVEPSGKYRAVVTLRGKRISKTFDTKDECRQWMHEMKTEADGGLDTKNLKLTLGEYAAGWLENVKANRRPKTIIQYTDILTRYILPTLGNRVLRNIDASMLERFLNDLKGSLKKRLAVSKRKGNGDRTVHLVYTVLHALLHNATRKRIITYNPLEAVDKPNYKRVKKTRLTLEERQRYLAALEGDPLEVLLATAITKGLREGELLGLRWCDVNLEEGSLLVVQQVQRIPKEGLVTGTVKTEQSQRPIYLGKTMKQKLIEQREKVNLLKRFAGDRWVEHDLVFPSAVGGPIDPRNLLRRHKAILEKANLPLDITIHDLRHAAITTLNNDLNAPYKVTQELAGHSLVSTTMNIYTDDAESKMKRRYSDEAENLLFGA